MAANRYSLEQFDTELRTFLEFCRESNLSEKDIVKICQPLTSAAQRVKLVRRIKYLLLVCLAGTLLFTLTYVETFAWHLSAIGRIALIKMLPLWDWTALKNERCFLEKPWSKTEVSFDCVLCEAPDVYVTSGAEVKTYLELHKPIIITGALDGWPLYRRPALELADDVLLGSVPCRLSTNIHIGPMTVGRLLRKTHFNRYFLHFQNCDYEAVKSFRLLAPRPGFLPAELSPTRYSWLVASRNYNVSFYKSIELSDSVAVFAQVAGSNRVELVPRKNCYEECPSVEMELLENEALVFGSLWDLRYRPGPSGENLAVILNLRPSSDTFGTWMALGERQGVRLLFSDSNYATIM